jgi:hypothetical protein
MPICHRATRCATALIRHHTLQHTLGTKLGALSANGGSFQIKVSLVQRYLTAVLTFSKFALCQYIVFMSFV